MGDRPFASLAGDPGLARLSALAEARGVALHLVGGTVRDLLLGRTPEDLDLVVGGDPEPLAGAFAAVDGATTVVRLDEAPPTLRLVRRGVPRPRGLLDLTAYRAASLEADLALRDFTANAVAVPVAAVVAGEAPAVVDPTGGVADIGRRVLRMTAPSAFDDDPLRALRAHRLAATLDFRLDRPTARAAARRASRLARVSAERVAAETFRLLAAPAPAGYVAALGRAGLLEAAFGLTRPPEAGWRQALGRLAAALARPDRVLGPGAPALEAAALGEPLAGGRTRLALLRFALIAGAEAPEAARRLRLSHREVAFLETLAAVRRVAGSITREEAHDPAWLVRSVVRTAGEAAEAALLHAVVAAPRAGARRRLAEALGTLAATVRPRLAGPRLLSGEDLVAALGLAPGPAVGRLLAWLDEARAAGLVTDRDSALAFARAHAAEACRPEEHPV